MPGGGYALPGLQNIPLTPALSPKGRGRKDGSVQSPLPKGTREKRRLRAVLSLRSGKGERRLRAVPSLQSGEGEKTAPCSLLSPKRQGRKTAPYRPLSPKGRGRKDGSVQSPLSEAAREKSRLRAVPSLQSGEGEKTAPCSPLSPKGQGRKRCLRAVPFPQKGEGEKDGSVPSPLPYGERVRGRGRLTTSSAPYNTHRHTRRCAGQTSCRFLRFQTRNADTSRRRLRYPQKP